VKTLRFGRARTCASPSSSLPESDAADLSTASHGALSELQGDGRAFAVPAALNLIIELLTLDQIADARPLNSRDMDEYVFRAIIGLNEAVALLSVEPFHGSGSYR
jgi:hypothetical protein